MPTNKPSYRTEANKKKYLNNPKRYKKTVERNKARRHAIANGTARVGDGKDVNHIKPLDKGGKTTKSNTEVISAKKNRSAGAKLANSKSGRKKKYAKRLT